MVNEITKTAYEKFPIEADCSYEIDSGDSISSQTLTCMNTLTGANTKSTIIDSHTISGDQIVIVIKAGTAGNLHHITSKVVMVNGSCAECDIFLSIKDIVQDTFKKQPSEAFNILFDFENRISADIDTKNVSAIKVSDGSDATADVIASSTKDGKTIVVSVFAGTDSESYLISAKAVVGSYQFENIVRMDVIEK